DYSTMGAPALPGYPSTLQARDIDSNSNRTNVNSTNKVKNGSYTAATTGSAVQGYPSSFQSRDIKSSARPGAAAWEEHIDEHTNRRYFYNSITGKSSWGQPNA
ncbi:WW domain-containing protein, partial [Salmonella sp. s58408]|uniref:WW domain-containing protein n=1 Tax=Salmonella sp. s58408 TaxID=3159701 RepID=UPI003980FE6E